MLKSASIGLLLSVPVLAQQNFNIYGFMDIGFEKRFGMSENNFLKQESFINENPKLTLDNLNLYFDFVPNDRTRALVEINLADSPYDKTPGNASRLGKVTAEKTGSKEADKAMKEILSQVPDAKTGDARKSENFGGFYLERAWVDFTLMEGLTLKTGKFITPAGIWNVDHGSPIITTVRQPNQTDFFPIFPISQTGIMLYGKEFVGDHDLSWNLYMSTGREDTDEVNLIQDLKDYGYGAKVYMDLDVLDGTRVGVSGYVGKIKRGNKEFSVNPRLTKEQALDIVTLAGTAEGLGAKAQQMGAQAELLGAQAQGLATDKEYQTELQGEAIGAGIFTPEGIEEYITEAITDSAMALGSEAMSLGADAQKLGVQAMALGDSIGVLVENYIEEQASNAQNNGGLAHFQYEQMVRVQSSEQIVGAEFKTKYADFTLQGEVNYRMVRNDLKNDISTDYLAFYGLISYDIALSENMSLTPYMMYEQITWDHAGNNAEALGGLNQVPLEGWGSTWVGLNFGFYGNYRLKVEYQYAGIKTKNNYDDSGKLVSSDELYKEGDIDIETFSAQITVAF